MQIFGLLIARMKINQILYVIFQAPSQFSFKLCNTFSVATHNTCETFSLKQHMIWTKRAHQCKIFRLLVALIKVHPILHAIFETTRSEFIQILHHFSVSWKITALYFLAQTSYSLGTNNPSKWNFQTFLWLGENSPNSSCRIWSRKSVFL